MKHPPIVQDLLTKSGTPGDLQWVLQLVDGHAFAEAGERLQLELQTNHPDPDATISSASHPIDTARMIWAQLLAISGPYEGAWFALLRWSVISGDWSAGQILTTLFATQIATSTPAAVVALVDAILPAARDSKIAAVMAPWPAASVVTISFSVYSAHLRDAAIEVLELFRSAARGLE